MSETNSTTKQCTRCRETKIIQEFHRQTRSSDGYRSICKKCRAIAEGKVYIPYEPDGFKYCRHCEQMLPATNEYYQSVPNGKYGLESRCRACKNAEWVEHYHDDIEASREYARAQYAINPEPSRARSKRRTIEHPEYGKDWYEANKIRLKPIRRLYYENNRDWLLKCGREWAKNNGDRIRATQRRFSATEKGREHNRRSTAKYRERYPEIVRIRSRVAKHRKRAKIMMVNSSVGSNEILELYHDMEGRCGYCGMPVSLLVDNDCHIDHMIPLSRGGDDTIDNLCVSCRDCNLAKGDLTPSEWQAVRGW